LSADRNSRLSKSELFGIGAIDSRLLLPSYFRWAAAANDTMSAFLANLDHVATWLRAIRRLLIFGDQSNDYGPARNNWNALNNRYLFKIR
jgi:hypothetical protein